MIIQKIIGGLGNQMFQYAYIKALSCRNKTNFKLDINGFAHYKLHKYCLEVLAIDKKYAQLQEIPPYERRHSSNRYLNYLLLKIKGSMKKLDKIYHQEKQLNFDEKFLYIKEGYIEGYFQSEQYFVDYADEIRKDFTFVHPPSSQNQTTITMIQNSESVSVHIRRGDYLQGNNIHYHGVCSIEYYQQAIQYIQGHTSNPRFFFFSDDIQWVKDHIKTGNQDDVYVDHNTGDQSREDMRLMSLCKHNIIANSSFSWWGAWLNTNPNKLVIAPVKRFETKKIDSSNIIPQSWTRI